MGGGENVSGIDNLIRFGTDRDSINEGKTRDASKSGKKGGKASAKAKAKRKSMKEDLQYLLNLLTDSNKESFEPSEIVELAELQKVNISAQVAILLSQVIKAINGDTKAVEFIRDTVGEKPTQRIEAKAENVNIDESVKRMNEYFLQARKDTKNERSRLEELKTENEELKKKIIEIKGE